MMRIATSKACRGAAAVALTVLVTAGASAALAGQGAVSGHTGVTATDSCMTSIEACGPVNGWQEDNPQKPR
ncbi:hypothetical protein [Streptomyces sp. NPDC056600]|uniref:hypothetical protein n=1 Tax=Streptomyces sp. NPDC056600 TaxID=3345874 RepID=UPI0036963C52